MLKEVLDFLREKMKEVSFITLFFLFFGGVLVVIGSSKSVNLPGGIDIIDDFRWIIMSMGFLFIITGSIASLKRGKEPIDKNGKLFPMLYSFYGLRSDLSSFKIFQDFKIDRSKGTNRNAVYYMWADSYGDNTINASIAHNNNDGHYLRVAFNNNNISNKELWLSNIGILPIAEKALDNRPDSSSNKKYRYKHLFMLAKAQKDATVDLEKIGIVVRVRDRNLIYWEYADAPGECRQIDITTGEWQKKSVNLEDKCLWQKFISDGNRQHPAIEPDFSVVSGVTLVFGGYNDGGQTPTTGKGIVDLHQIFLDNN